MHARLEKKPDLGLRKQFAFALIRDRSEIVRAAAADALGSELSDPSSVEALVAALQSDSSSTVRCRAAWALKWSRHPSSVEALAAALQSDSSFEVRSYAGEALGSTGDKTRAVPSLVEAFCGDSFEAVRAACARSLGELRASDAIDVLVRTQKQNPPEAIQVAIVEALGRLAYSNEDNSGIVEYLLSIWRTSDNEKVRLESLRRLGTLRKVDTIIEDALLDRSPVIAERAADIVEKIGSFGSFSVRDFWGQLLVWFARATRTSVSLKGNGTESIIRLLRRLIASSEWEVKHEKQIEEMVSRLTKHAAQSKDGMEIVEALLPRIETIELFEVSM